MLRDDPHHDAPLGDATSGMDMNAIMLRRDLDVPLEGEHLTPIQRCANGCATTLREEPSTMASTYPFELRTRVVASIQDEKHPVAMKFNGPLQGESPLSAA